MDVDILYHANVSLHDPYFGGRHWGPEVELTRLIYCCNIRSI